MEQTAPAAPPAAPRTIGERLRAGRERAGLSVAAAAEKLHLDNKVIEALESDRFADLGASVYVRGHLRRYADFVGEQGIELVNAYSAREARPPPPDLTQIPHAERRSDPRRLITPMVGLGCAVVLAVAIWWVLSGSHARGQRTATSATTVAQVRPAAATADSSPAATSALRVADNSAAPAQAVAPSAVEVAGSVARREAPAADAAAAAKPTRLRLELASESWVEVYDSRGERLFYDVAGAGSVQSIEGRPPLRVVLGNAAAVSVQVDGQPREIPAGAVDGEGARFIVNRTGTLARSRP